MHRAGERWCATSTSCRAGLVATVEIVGQGHGAWARSWPSRLPRCRRAIPTSRTTWPRRGSPNPAPVLPPRAPTLRTGVTRTGTAKADLLRGTPFADVLRGLGGADRLFGLGGADRLIGGPGKDILSGGDGNDTISARDGARDTISCGRGRDVVVADRLDRVAARLRDRPALTPRRSAPALTGPRSHGQRRAVDGSDSRSYDQGGGAPTQGNASDASIVANRIESGTGV